MQQDEYGKMFQLENSYWWYRGLHELIRAYVKKHMKKDALGASDTAKRSNPSNPSEPLRIFDAGCGTGRMMELLQDCGEVHGLDYSQEAVHMCTQRKLTHVEQGDLNIWSPEPGTYDVIVSSDVLSNSGVEDDMAVLDIFHKALKPGGIMILNLPAFEALRRVHDIAIFGKRRYRRHVFKKQLKEKGFTIARGTYRLPLLFCFLLLQKHLLERNVKPDDVVDSDLKPLPAWLNSLMLLMHRIENGCIRSGISLPFGSSLFIVARKS